MRRIMELLGRLILNEVQRKTCVSLSADMREFLGWILEVEREEESSDDVRFVVMRVTTQFLPLDICSFVMRRYRRCR